LSIRSQEQVALLTDYDAGSAYSEAYHTLYANIRFNWNSTQGKQHTLLLTTPAAYAGQATVATNVAITAAQSGTPAILVDADLRTPSIEQRFGLEKSAGLYNLLLEESLTAEKIEQHLRKTFIPGLRLLSAGMAAEEAATLLLSAKLKDVLCKLCQFLEETESEPGIVIFNSPPVLAGPDASLIAALAEQTILTIAKSRITHTQAKLAQEQLQRAHANLAGIVLLDI
jgi:capsular exopolysaccharide synthesis family protein